MRLGRLRQVHAWVGHVPGVGVGVWVRVCGVCGGVVGVCDFGFAAWIYWFGLGFTVKKCKYLSRSTLSFLLSQDSRFSLSLSFSFHRFLQVFGPGSWGASPRREKTSSFRIAE